MDNPNVHQTLSEAYEMPIQAENHLKNDAAKDISFPMTGTLENVPTEGIA